MSRPSNITLHPRLAEINVALSRGDAVADIASRFGISTSSLYRYRTSSWGRASLEHARGERPATIDYVAALSGAVDALNDVLARAVARQDDGAVIKAASALLKALTDALKVFGLDSSDAAAYARQDAALSRVLLALVSRTPSLAQDAATLLRNDNLHSLADELSAYADALPTKAQAV
jgi:transposase-like protein